MQNPKIISSSFLTIISCSRFDEDDFIEATENWPEDSLNAICMYALEIICMENTGINLSVELPNVLLFATNVTENISILNMEVIAEILHNAAKYSKNGERLDLTFKLFVEEDTAVIVIRDNGIGMSPDDLDCIFDSGYRALNGILRNTGTGFGLNIAKNTVEESFSGSIEVDSIYNVGTTFTIKIPCSRTSRLSG